MTVSANAMILGSNLGNIYTALTISQALLIDLRISTRVILTTTL